ncbi:MAG: uracil-DNA glycosylase [Anaerolineales bacterium]|jgi:uracil-DNA glycosylase family 4
MVGSKRIEDELKALEGELVRCKKCPRLVAWREQIAREKRRAYLEWDYWGKPVPGFGDPRARLLLVGLAPGAHGSNRTGRMFTGDSSGDTLFAALHRAGFASQPESTSREDGLQLRDAFITALARCVPPQNRPTAREFANCRPYLKREINMLPDVRVVLALGGLAFNGVLRTWRDQGHDVPRLKFKHGAWHEFDAGLPVLAACYHPSPQNTFTGRLTEGMLDRVFGRIKDYLAAGGPSPG